MTVDIYIISMYSNVTIRDLFSFQNKVHYSKHNIASVCICMGILIFELFDNT